MWACSWTVRAAFAVQRSAIVARTARASSARNALYVWPAVAQQRKISRTKQLACGTRTTAEMRHIPGSVGRLVGMTDLPVKFVFTKSTSIFFACSRTSFCS